MAASKTANKTVQTDASVEEFLRDKPVEQQADSRALIKIMQEISGQPPKMWGPSIIGFDTCHYKYESGREGDMGVLGFSPRKANMTVYFADGISRYEEQLARLGKHSTAKVCLYIKRLSDIDVAVLKEMLTASYAYVKGRDGEMGRAE